MSDKQVSCSARKNNRVGRGQGGSGSGEKEEEEIQGKGCRQCESELIAGEAEVEEEAARELLGR